MYVCACVCGRVCVYACVRVLCNALYRVFHFREYKSTASMDGYMAYSIVEHDMIHLNYLLLLDIKVILLCFFSG